MTFLCRSLPGLIFITVYLANPFGSEAEVKFSHRLHLRQAGATCVDCHRSAASSTAARDDNLPGSLECGKCHDGKAARPVDNSALAERQSAERTYRFNHEFHLQLGNIAPLLAAAVDNGTYLGGPGDIRRHLDTASECQACHRGLEETDTASDAHLPRMSDCLICHSEVNNPFSCEQCHLENVNLRPRRPHANLC